MNEESAKLTLSKFVRSVHYAERSDFSSTSPRWPIRLYLLETSLIFVQWVFLRDRPGTLRPRLENWQVVLSTLCAGLHALLDEGNIWAEYEGVCPVLYLGYRCLMELGAGYWRNSQGQIFQDTSASCNLDPESLDDHFQTAWNIR